ncbi:aldo/keto reductase [Kitasatospora sp. NPDC059795]|uniref:aldo/keto reductase n=1 Tax=Kitasatospora sp. NPDC059795 TaxID=3346949 RepID=UPI003664E646
MGARPATCPAGACRTGDTGAALRGGGRHGLPTSSRHGPGVLAWSPLGGGVLAGRYARGTAPDGSSRIGRLLGSPSPLARAWAGSLLTGRNLGIAEEVADVAAALGATSTAVALAWLRRRSGVTSVILGPRTVGQLVDNLAGFTLELPAEAVARLDEVSGT